MCLFPQAFSLIFRLEFFKRHAACTALGIGSILIAKIRVGAQSLQTITSFISPNSFLFYNTSKYLGYFDRRLKYGAVILLSDYSDDVCDIQVETGCSGCEIISRFDVIVMI